VHAAPRRSHDQPEVGDSQTLGQQTSLRIDHVVVRVPRKLHPQSVTRLARFPVTDPVGQDDEVLRRVQQLSWSKELTGIRPRHEAAAGAGRAVQDEHSVANRARPVASRCSQREVVNAQRGHRIARGKNEILEDEIGAGGRLCASRRGERDERQSRAEERRMGAGNTGWMAGPWKWLAWCADGRFNNRRNTATRPFRWLP
jgi:hypothetical protein